MAFLDAINWLYVASGFLVGFLVGMTGVGGGALMTPLLILLFNVSPVTAVGTDLLYASVTKSGGSLVHALHRLIDWKLVWRLAMGSVPASIVTIAMLYYLKFSGGAANMLVTKTLSVALLFTAVSLVLRRFLLILYARLVGELNDKLTARLTTATGVVLGTLVSLTSVGAGALGVTALILLYPRMDVRKIVGSDIAHAVPLTLVAGMGHWVGGSIDGPLLLSLLTGSLPGILIGSYLVPRMPEPVLRYSLATVLALVAFRFFAQ